MTHSAKHGFAQQRALMVETQLRTRDVSDRRVLAAFGAVARELFLPPAQQALAYADSPVSSTTGEMLPPAGPLAQLFQLAAFKDDQHVLVVGSPYAGAIAKHLAAEVTIHAAGAEPPSAGLYDLILFAGSVEAISEIWFQALRPQGRLVALVQKGPVQTASVFLKTQSGISSTEAFNAVLPALPGFEAKPVFSFAV